MRQDTLNIQISIYWASDDVNKLTPNSNEKSEINVGSKVKEPIASATGKAKISGEMVKTKCEVLFIAEELDDGLSETTK